MKKFALALTAAVSIASVASGKVYWDEKIEKQTAAASEQVMGSPVAKQEEKKTYRMPDLTRNLPKPAADLLIQAEKTGKPVKLLFFGSDTGNGTAGSWSQLVQENLKADYPSGIIEVQTQFLKDRTSKDVLSEKLYKEAAASSPDILIFEPFILKDNGKIGITNTLENVTAILKELRAANPELVLMIQPSFPLHEAVYYPKEVEQLKEFAKKEKIPYLDHWKSWPETSSPELLDYLDSEESNPSQKGHKVWADYLTKVFVAK